MSLQVDELAAMTYADKVRAAKAMSPTDRFLAGARLHDMACRIARDAIRNQHPSLSEDEVNRHLKERLAVQRRLDEKS